MSQETKVLVLDDDPGFLRSMALALEGLCDIHLRSDPRGVIEVIENLGIQIVICDYRMEFIDGLEVTKEIRHRFPYVPVILVTAFADLQVALKAINLRVFGILEKPLDLTVLRNSVVAATQEHEFLISALKNRSRDILFDLEKRSVSLDGVTARLTEIEDRILRYFTENRGRCLSRSQINFQVWGSDRLAANVLDTHLGNLKKKLPTLRQKIVVVRGRGYVFDPGG